MVYCFSLDVVPRLIRLAVLVKLNALRVSDILCWLQWLIMDAAHYITPLPLIMGLWRGLKKAFYQRVQSREGAM